MSLVRFLGANTEPSCTHNIFKNTIYKPSMSNIYLYNFNCDTFVYLYVELIANSLKNEVKIKN